MNKPLFELINLKPIVDDRGKLIFAEGENNIPFKIKRFFCLYDIASGAARGEHAHKKTRLVLFCLASECTVVLNNGSDIESIRLSHPDEGLLVEPRIWHHIEKCSRGAVILAVASEHYNESDYLRDYNKFKAYI